jgi:ABC-2 type transport system ATP-binding protein
MSSIIQARNLHKQYDPPNGVVAVKDVSFDIERGEIFSLLGPNGAGKTTVMSLLTGLLRSTSGDTLIDGHSIRADPLQAKRVLGIVPDEIALYRTITARENLAFWGKMYGLGGAKLQERIDAMLELSGLADRADDKVETFSGGMKRRLNIAVGLLHEPRVVFMDEPTVGIDPQSRRRILDTVKELNRQGVTVLFTTHYMEEAEELSDRIGIIDHGDLIAVGTQAELSRIVNEYDTVTIHMGAETSSEETASALADLPGVHHAVGQNSHVVLQALDVSSLLQDVVTCATRNGGSIKRLEIQEPNLEAVFMHLTGRALRD